MGNRGVLTLALCFSALAAYVWTPAAYCADVNVELFGGRGSYLGVGLADIDANRAKELSLKEERGVEITRVEADSPAEKAGLKTADVVVDYNGTRVEGVEQFMRLVRETPVGREVKLGVIRGGAPQSLALRTGEHRGFSLNRGDDNAHVFRVPEMRGFDFAIPEMPNAHLGWNNPRLGIEGESLDGQLASYFGVTDGVLVRSVVKDSAAEKAGIRAGDVILRVDGDKVTSTREISRALRSDRAESKTNVAVVLMREKKEMTLNVAVEKPSGEQVRRRGTGRIGARVIRL